MIESFKKFRLTPTNKGERLWNALLDQLDKLRINVDESGDIRLEQGMNYTKISVRKKISETATALLPWEIYSYTDPSAPTDRKWKIHRGSLCNVFADNDDYDPEAALIIDSPTAGDKVWLEADVTWTDTTATVTALTIDTGATLPSIDWPEDGTLPATIYIQLGSFSGSPAVPFNDVRNNLTMAPVLAYYQCTTNGAVFVLTYILSSI